MKLYHYLPKENNARKVGILTLSKKPEEIKKYGKRLGTEDVAEITTWLEQSFLGRTRAVSGQTEPVQTKGTDPMLKEWVAQKELVSIDLDRLLSDGKVESIWCKESSDAYGKKEKIYQIQPNKIDFTPLPWDKCSQAKGLFFGVIRHYLIVLKEGVIPPEYIHFE